MSTSNSGNIQTLYKSRKILLEYFKLQQYDISDYENFSINEVNTMLANNQLDMLIEEKKNDDKKKTYIKYHLKKSLRPQYIDEYVEDLYNLDQILKKDDILVIISKDEPNDTLITHLKQLYSDDGYYIIVFSLKRLQFNILEHTLVPKHRKLTSKESDDIMKKYNILDKNQLPEISRFDPIALAIGLRPDDICEITRPSKTAIHGTYYRYCLNT
jgi:DNA-directed RNA polymerase subunit H|tara:strand:+ start:200 stop:841 length:642 start_codon:yes stop_codon:yes gene_type:complete